MLDQYGFSLAVSIAKMTLTSIKKGRRLRYILKGKGNTLTCVAYGIIKISFTNEFYRFLLKLIIFIMKGNKEFGNCLQFKPFEMRHIH
jgi:hypothetical protein